MSFWGQIPSGKDRMRGALTPSSNRPAIKCTPYLFRCDCATRPDRYRAQQWIRDHLAMVSDLPQVVCVENVTRALRTNDTSVLSDQMPNEGVDLFVMPIEKFIQVS